MWPKVPCFQQWGYQVFMGIENSSQCQHAVEGTNALQTFLLCWKVSPDVVWLLRWSNGCMYLMHTNCIKHCNIRHLTTLQYYLGCKNVTSSGQYWQVKGSVCEQHNCMLKLAGISLQGKIGFAVLNFFYVCDKVISIWCTSKWVQDEWTGRGKSSK